MNLYLIRHSIAEKISPSKKDFERELTSGGNQLLRSAVEYWKGIVPGFDLIIIFTFNQSYSNQ